MCLDIPVEPCQTLPCVWNWEALARLSWCGPVVLSGPHRFQRPSSLRCRSHSCPREKARSTCTCTRSSSRSRYGRQSSSITSARLRASRSRSAQVLGATNARLRFAEAGLTL